MLTCRGIILVLNIFTITWRKQFCKSFKPNRNFDFFFCTAMRLFFHIYIPYYEIAKDFSILSIGKSFFLKRTSGLKQICLSYYSILDFSLSPSFCPYTHSPRKGTHTTKGINIIWFFNSLFQ